MCPKIYEFTLHHVRVGIQSASYRIKICNKHILNFWRAGVGWRVEGLNRSTHRHTTYPWDSFYFKSSLETEHISNRGSYMSHNVLLNLLNELGKSILSLFCNKFNKFNNTGFVIII